MYCAEQEIVMIEISKQYGDMYRSPSKYVLQTVECSGIVLFPRKLYYNRCAHNTTLSLIIPSFEMDNQWSSSVGHFSP
ncbi:hypothetical protein QQG55_49380 [Brugia pahangi]|uniref:ZP domain-containing protein n=1 Tax=Brugia pahangi TaxID=6280 RepID=A0A0N4SWW4_BRUPA|nr:unnamed protein product [Brugia pahangi]